MEQHITYAKTTLFFCSFYCCWISELLQSYKALSARIDLRAKQWKHYSKASMLISIYQSKAWTRGSLSRNMSSVLFLMPGINYKAWISLVYSEKVESQWAGNNYQIWIERCITSKSSCSLNKVSWCWDCHMQRCFASYTCIGCKTEKCIL